MPIIDRLLSKIKIDKTSECWEWQAARTLEGYGQLHVKRRKRFAHRISYTLHRGPIPEGMQVCHHCDNPCCVNPDHLFIGTQADNIADKFAKGRGVTPRLHGSDHGRAKLTEVDVAAIRATEGKSHRHLAAQYGVSKSTIGGILARKWWGHI